MGTARPLVHIEAATLAGGDNNQDRYAYGDGWAFVLDGATSYSDTPPVHDGGWYAERLKNALAPRLTRQPERATVDIVADAIREAASAHHPSQGPCPTSTIALARWDAERVELYVLGDSYACAITEHGAVFLTDTRIKQFGKGLRTLYRQRLREGHGFDGRHREILAALQCVETAHRNRPGGYWIAGESPEAARHSVARYHKASLRHAVLATDGIAPGLPGMFKSPSRSSNLQALLLNQRRREDSDPNGSKWPRSKPNDDKTVVDLQAFHRPNFRQSQDESA